MKRMISKANPKTLIRNMLLFVLLLGLGWIPPMGSVLVSDAEAVVGRPGSPRSAAGVARRTTRRRHRRHRIAVGTRVTVLPAGCTTVITRGVTYHYCGDVYYRPYYEGNTVVYVVEEP
jgi:hypothetical protein